LGGITYPLLSDFYPHGHVAQSYGVLRAEGYSERALFIIDKQGIIRYIDVHDINQQPDNEVLFEALEKLEPNYIKKPQIDTILEKTKELVGDIIMYCTPWCPECRRVRAFFTKHNIQYTEVDISRDRASAAKVRSWANGNETTPTFSIKGTIIVNFDQAKIKQLLDIKD